MVMPGKDGGVPQVPVQPCHGAQAEHGRQSSCPPVDHVPATPSSWSVLVPHFTLKTFEVSSVTTTT